ncbi:hypothetical protein AA0Z99_08535 [Agrococcus sp. 1P02AA]|uniref:hypothetical protein n=1 Tax=Agrococcus sp. 1P02AA TaxID=3132259 RepID=UPI0039A54C90
METIEQTPDRGDAAASLAAVAAAERAVRDRPWPLWLYPANALLLGGVAIAGLIPSSMIGAIVVVALASAMAALNYGAGRRMGTPFAIPTSRGFRILVAASGAFVLLAMLARAAELPWAIIACTVGAIVAYALASVLHLRSTRR